MAAKVISVDFLQKQNSTSHHTKDFNTKGLAVRRGQEFTIKLSFDVAPGPEEDITLQFALGEKTARNKDANIAVPVKSAPDDARWCATVSETPGKEVLTLT